MSQAGEESPARAWAHNRPQKDARIVRFGEVDLARAASLALQVTGDTAHPDVTVTTLLLITIRPYYHLLRPRIGPAGAELEAICLGGEGDTCYRLEGRKRRVLSAERSQEAALAVQGSCGGRRAAVGRRCVTDGTPLHAARMGRHVHCARS